jgi:hypothetical protein
MIPARLYDGPTPTGTEIAAVRVTTQRRASFPGLGYKNDDGWETRLDGGDAAITMRVIAVGHAEVEWIATLYQRQEARALNTYSVELQTGETHVGPFMVEALDEELPPQGHRQFRLVLISAGKVTYSSGGSP